MKIKRRTRAWAPLATATGTSDSSGSNLRLAHICRMNAAFRPWAGCNLVAVTRCAAQSFLLRYSQDLTRRSLNFRQVAAISFELSIAETTQIRRAPAAITSSIFCKLMPPIANQGIWMLVAAQRT